MSYIVAIQDHERNVKEKMVVNFGNNIKPCFVEKESNFQKLVPLDFSASNSCCLMLMILSAMAFSSIVHSLNISLKILHKKNSTNRKSSLCIILVPTSKYGNAITRILPVPEYGSHNRGTMKRGVRIHRPNHKFELTFNPNSYIGISTYLKH